MTFRAFIAADLPPLPAVDALARELRGSSDSLKVVATDHLHLTLKFLGDTEDGLVPDIVAAMLSACAGIGPVDLRVRGTGAFPSLSRPSVLWVSVEGGEPLATIAARLEEALERFGYPKERRPWRAHVTLARVRGGRGLDPVRAVLRARAEETFGEARIEEVRLKRSVLRPGGPEYATVEAVRLPG